MKKGDIIYADTNAELLNNIIGTHYIDWMKTIYFYGDNAYIWMVNIDGRERSGWRNWFSNDYIIEEQLDTKVVSWGGIPLSEMAKKTRFVFEKKDGYFRFLGVYKIDQNKSNITNTGKPRRNYLQLISDTWSIGQSEYHNIQSSDYETHKAKLTIINIKNHLVKLKDGTITWIENQDDSSIYLTIRGIKKKYNYVAAFAKGTMVALDKDLQTKIMNGILSIRAN